MNDSQRQSLSHAIKAVLNDVKEFDVKFKHPFNTICTGPSQSGKSCFVKTLLHKRQIEPFPSRLLQHRNYSTVAPSRIYLHKRLFGTVASSFGKFSVFTEHTRLQTNISS